MDTPHETLTVRFRDYVARRPEENSRQGNPKNVMFVMPGVWSYGATMSDQFAKYPDMTIIPVTHSDPKKFILDHLRETYKKHGRLDQVTLFGHGGMNKIVMGVADDLPEMRIQDLLLAMSKDPLLNSNKGIKGPAARFVIYGCGVFEGISNSDVRFYREQADVMNMAIVGATKTITPRGNAGAFVQFTSDGQVIYDPDWKLPNQKPDTLSRSWDGCHVGKSMEEAVKCTVDAHTSQRPPVSLPTPNSIPR